MKEKILVLSLYPAPYRAELYEYFFKEFEVNVFLNPIEAMDETKIGLQKEIINFWILKKE